MESKAVFFFSWLTWGIVMSCSKSFMAVRSFHVLKMEILGRPNAATFCHHFAMGFLGSDWDVFCERFH